VKHFQLYHTEHSGRVSTKCSGLPHTEIEESRLLRDCPSGLSQKPGSEDPDTPYIAALNLAKLKKRKTKKAAIKIGAT